MFEYIIQLYFFQKLNENKLVNSTEKDLRVYPTRRAKQILKWKPKVSITDGLKITFDWAMKNKVEFSAPFKRFYYKNSK